MNRMMTCNLWRQLDLKTNRQVIKRKIEENLENGKEYVGINKTPYQNLILDKRILKTKKHMQGIGHLYHTRW